MPQIKLSSTTKPFTPMPAMRRFFSDIWKPRAAIGKRSRDVDEEQESEDPSRNIPQVSESNRNCIALQNDDADEDAVVITALTTVPFCCHADLLLMKREQLIEVASTLNLKLPLAMRIDISTMRSDNFIRHSIELLVGIRHAVPQAPKANRSISLSVSNFDSRADSIITSILPLSPVSPLRMPNRMSMHDHIASPPLASLREENEDGMEEANRPPKRRRTNDWEDSSPDVSPTPIRRKVLRSQSHGGRQASQPIATRDGRVLRSRSERLPPVKLNGVHRNVTMTRGRGRDNRFERAAPVIMTSTPKLVMKQRRMSTVEDGAVLPIAESRSMGVSCSSQSSSSCTPRLQRVGIWLTRMNAADSEKDADEVANGMGNLSVNSALSTSVSDMDISISF